MKNREQPVNMFEVKRKIVNVLSKRIIFLKRSCSNEKKTQSLLAIEAQ